MNKAIIFDMDGVIIDSEPLWQEVEHAFFAIHGGTYTPQLLEKLMGSSPIQCAQVIKDELGIEMELQEIIDARHNALLDLFEKRLELIPGFEALADEVLTTDLKRGLASGNTNEAIQFTLDRFDLGNFFQDTLSGADVPHPKPAPDIYLESARRLGVDPKNCVVIEDSPNGLRSAKAAGMKCIATPNPSLEGISDFSSADLIRPNLAAITIHDIMGLL